MFRASVEHGWHFAKPLCNQINLFSVKSLRCFLNLSEITYNRLLYCLACNWWLAKEGRGILFSSLPIDKEETEKTVTFARCCISNLSVTIVILLLSTQLLLSLCIFLKITGLYKANLIRFLGYSSNASVETVYFHQQLMVFSFLAAAGHIIVNNKTWKLQHY